MLKRCIACLAIALYSVCAWAGFGPIHVYSRLGEPLRAEVSLIDTVSSDFLRWRVGLADRAAFDDLNLVYTPELADLRFTLRSGADGPVVEIRSLHPIKTPYLQFVLQLRTLNEHWVQGFFFKLEPLSRDVVDGEQSAAPPAPPRSLVVEKGDNLASLAAKILPPGVRAEQAMASLVLANPTKFLPGEPPQPKLGATLAVPWVRTMRALSPARVRATLHSDLAKPHADTTRSTGWARAKPLPSRPLSPARAEAAPTRQPAEKIAVPPTAASQPTAVKPPLNASQIAAYAASDTAAQAQIKTLQQQVDSRAQDLQKAKKHIDQLNQKIKSLQASEAATASLVANGFHYQNPSVLMAAGGALLLAGLFFVLGRRWRREGKKKAVKDPGKHALSSTGVAQPDPQAAEAAGKGDPLAEAEVYLAYGHDDQAEEILRKALDLHPGRQDLHGKLLEIYAARPDRAKFERLAREVREAYDGRGAQWERTRVMGLSIDPDNPLYQPEGASAPPAATPMMDFSALEAPADEVALPEAASAPAAVRAASASDGDSLLDFDFSLESPVQTPTDLEPDLSMLDGTIEAALAAEAPQDTGLTWPEEPARTQAEAMPEESAIAMEEAPAAPDESAAARMASPAAMAVVPEEAAVAVEAPAEPVGVAVEDIDLPPSKDEEALSTKLDLAQVYLDMGDSEGAREVLVELSREARGKLKERAEAMLAQVGRGEG